MNAQLSYLESEVMSASGPKLRLMLIEAALRLARQSLPELETHQLEPARDKLTRVRKILWELLASVRDPKGEIGRNIQRVYTYLIRTVTEAHLTACPDKVSDLVHVLEVERGTWREVSARLAGERVFPTTASRDENSEPSTGPNAGSSFSIEA